MPSPKPPPSPGEDVRTITCLYCHKPQEVAQHAMSITCKFCYKPLKLEGITIAAYEARRHIATCGVLTVEKKGNIVSELILCARMVIRGRVKGKIESQGPVLIGRDAEVKGDIKAPSLAVGAGAVLDGQYEIGVVSKKSQPSATRP